MAEYRAPSVELAMRILKLLSRYKYKSCSLKEISELLNSNAATCLRVLRTLAKDDFVSFHPETKKYSLGPYLIPLGNRAKELNGSASMAIAELKSVVELTGLTTVLIERLQDDHLIYIGSEEPSNEQVKISVSIGQQFAIDKVAFGRCFLAYDDEAGWERPNPSTLENLVQKLREIRERGYVVSHGELTPGISSFAAPIFDKTGHVQFVMACLAMTTQLSCEQEPKVIDALLEKTHKLSEWNNYPQR